VGRWKPPGFAVSFKTELFDCEHAQGIAATVRHQHGPVQHSRHAVKIRHDSTPAQAAVELRKLADWIEAVNP
jgi:hypothetical protein